MLEGESSTPSAPRRRISWLIRIGGVAIAGLAIAFCAVAVADQWHTVSTAIVHANYALVGVAFLSAAAGMTGLGVMWWYCLRLFGVTAGPADAVSWYFAGELGKYIPGGVWPVLGRGELAQRGGHISRSTGYATTLISYAAMSIAAALVCGALAPAVVLHGGAPPAVWLIVLLIPVGLTATHPAVMARVLEAGSKVTRGRLDLKAPSWTKMLALIATAIPTWVLVGLASVIVTRSLGFHQSPARVAFAAVAAWIIGFLAVPVPAGAGLREIIFVALAGLGTGRGTTVAAGARLLLVLVDGSGGVIGLVHTRPGIGRQSRPAPTQPSAAAEHRDGALRADG